MSALPFAGPTASLEAAGLLAFYFPGHSTAADEVCQAGFLGNFFPSLLQIRCQSKEEMGEFQNAEAAFQCLKFWSHKDQFHKLSAEEAFRLSRSLHQQDLADDSYGGYGSNWLAMRHVLTQKFQDEKLKEMLLATKDAFLLEHNPKFGRDVTWSNNSDGSGKNWLGLQLMLLRDQLRGSSGWTDWLQQHLDLATGEPSGAEWPRLVRQATEAIRAALPETSA
ncbi:unnamed protein product [Effrenium voratum]|nr:unnamed protein product [Effrenium voratum]